MEGLITSTDLSLSAVGKKEARRGGGAEDPAAARICLPALEALDVKKVKSECWVFSRSPHLTGWCGCRRKREAAFWRAADLEMCFNGVMQT